MTDITAIKFTAKADLVKALKAKRSAMVERDRELKTTHAAAERKALVDFRTRCKELGALSYAEAATRSTHYAEMSAPSCPILWVPRLDRVLGRLELTSQEAFTVNPRSDLWDLLTFGEPALSPC